MLKKVFILIIFFGLMLCINSVFAAEGTCNPVCAPEEFCFEGTDTCVPKGADEVGCDGNYDCLSGKCSEKDNKCFTIPPTETRVTCGDYTCEKDGICDTATNACAVKTAGATGATTGGAGTTAISFKMEDFVKYWNAECPKITDVSKCVFSADTFCLVKDGKCILSETTGRQIEVDLWCELLSKTSSPALVGCVASAGTSAGTSAGGGGEPPVIVGLVNPMGGIDEEGKRGGDLDMRKLLGNIIAKGMGMLGGIALLVFIYGGFQWLTSAGSPEKVKSGMQAMLWAVIGLFLIFGAYAIIKMFFTAIGAKESSYNPWGIENYSGSDTNKATEGCYCFEVKTEGKSLVKTPAKVFQISIVKEKCEKSSNTSNGVASLMECEWQTFTTK